MVIPCNVRMRSICAGFASAFLSLVSLGVALCESFGAPDQNHLKTVASWREALQYFPFSKSKRKYCSDAGRAQRSRKDESPWFPKSAPMSHRSRPELLTRAEIQTRSPGGASWREAVDWSRGLPPLSCCLTQRQRRRKMLEMPACLAV